MSDDLTSERGRITWLSSGEDEGPDCGLIVGLGNGLSLHAGEFANRTLEEHGVDPVEHAASWHLALYSQATGWRFFGTVTDTVEAQHAIEEIAGALLSEGASL